MAESLFATPAHAIASLTRLIGQAPTTVSNEKR